MRLADLRPENAEAAAKTLTDAGFEVTTATVDVSARDLAIAVGFQGFCTLVKASVSSRR